MPAGDAPRPATAPDDGTAERQGVADLVIRPISADDKVALAEGFDRLSEESRYRRFLSPHNRLSSAELRYFTEVDHHDHEALVAIDPDSGLGVGIARYVRSTEDPAAAELAIAVVDDWQRMGVGTRLATALADRAREEGITRFTGLMLAENELMINLARELGDARVLHQEPGTVELTVALGDEGPGRLARLLRAVTTGGVTALPARLRPAKTTSD